MNELPPSSIWHAALVRPWMPGVLMALGHESGLPLLLSYSMESPVFWPCAVTCSVSAVVSTDSMTYVGPCVPAVWMSDDARTSMNPPTVIDAPVPMYASTVGLAVAVDSEPPMPMKPPDTPCDAASASGSAVAEMCRFDVRCTSDEPATYALMIGFAWATASFWESAKSPPDAASDEAFAVLAELAEMLTLFAPTALLGPMTSAAT